MTNEKEYPLNLIENIFGSEIDFELAEDFDGTLEYVLHNLTERERKVIKMRFEENLTYEKCGKAFGVTRERIRQVEVKALRKLRHPSRATMIKYGIRKYIDRQVNGITEFYEARLRGKEPPQLENMSIENMDLSVRSYNCLKRAGIVTVKDLIKLEPNELASIRNLGRRSYDEIVAKIEKYGLETQKFIDYKKGIRH